MKGGDATVKVKILINLLLILVCFTPLIGSFCGTVDSAYAGPEIFMMRKVASGGGSQAAAYAGANINSSTGAMVANNGTDTFYNVVAWNESFTCPGTGTREIDEISTYSYVANGTMQWRLYLYTGAGAFVGQTPATNISNTTVAWQTATTFQNKTGGALSPLTCTGGSSYILAGSSSDYNVSTPYGTASTNAQYNTSYHYDSNPSLDPLSGGSASSQNFGLRIHVKAVP